MRGRKRAGQSGTVDVFGPYCGGGDVDKSVGKREKALEFTVVSKVLRRWTQDLLEEINELVLTSFMLNMNITYKMPHVSTKLYTYIYVYTEKNKK